MSRALASIWFSNTNGNHEDTGVLKEHDSYSNSFWSDSIQKAYSLLQEKVLSFLDTIASLSILSSFLLAIGDVRRLVRAKKKKKKEESHNYFEDLEGMEVKS